MPKLQLQLQRAYTSDLPAMPKRTGIAPVLHIVKAFENATVSVEVTYQCIEAGEYIVSLRLDGTLTRSATAFWRKRCGDGVRKGVYMALASTVPENEDRPTKALIERSKEQKENPDVVTDGAVQPRWLSAPSATSAITVAPSEQVSRFFLWNTLGTVTLTAKVESSTPKLLDAKIAGSPSSAANYSDPWLAGGEEDPTPLGVVYYCAGLGVATVRLALLLESYETLVITWRKNCGGGRNTDLRVGTMYHHNDVVKAGKTQGAWDAARSGADAPDFPATDLQINFYIAAEPGALFNAMATAASGSQIVQTTAFLKRHGPRTFKVTVFHYCKRDGPAHVHVILTQQAYTPVEWRYTKLCDRLIQDQDHGNGWTGSQWLWGTAFLAVGLLAAMWCCLPTPCLSFLSTQAAYDTLNGWLKLGSLGACRAYLCPRHQKQAYTKLDSKVASSPDANERGDHRGQEPG